MTRAYLWILAILVIVFGVFVTVRNTLTKHELTQSKPLAVGLPTEVKVIPVQVLKNGPAESRLRVKLPAGHSVTATADLKPSKTGYGVLSVIDVKTGVSVMQQYEKPQAAFGFPMDGAVSGGAGTGSAGQTLRLAAEFTPIRVGDLYLTGEAEARLSTLRAPDYYLGAKIVYRFELW